MREKNMDMKAMARTGLMQTMALLAWALLAVNAQAASPSDGLPQMVRQSQANPADDALREKIIRQAQRMKPAPAIPEEAERRMARGAAAIKGAKSVADYQAAAKEFEQATLAAPWYGDAYFNLGVAHDKAENYEAALRSLKLALLAMPNDKEIKALIYEVEYRSEKARSPEAVAERERDKLRKDLDGAVYEQKFNYAYNHYNNWEVPEEAVSRAVLFIEIHGNEMTSYQALEGQPNSKHVEDRFRASFTSREFETSCVSGRCKVQISDDGQSIVVETWALPQPSMYWRQTYKRIR